MEDQVLKNLIRERLQNAILHEGWKENLIFLGAMALSSIGGVKAQAPTYDRDRNNVEASQQLKTSYSAMVGYLANMPKESPEEMAAIKEARIYFEALRDGKTGKTLSGPAKAVVDFAISETKKLNGQQLYSLSQAGMNIHSQQ